MPHTIYVVQGFRGGRKTTAQCFKTEALARARAAYLGASLDGVVMWRQSADSDADNPEGGGVVMDGAVAR
jgi:hypothetical protein